ncbi:type II toxin-antitoxin system HicB family antitoxin [Lacticaseibacillus saniviri]
MRVTYPALFYYDPNESVPFFVSFPDFENSATQGSDISDAMLMASDWLGLTVSSLIEEGEAVPNPSSINQLSLIDNDPFKDDPEFDTNYDLSKSFISMVSVDLTEYLSSDKPIKKTLTIPKWADDRGKKLKINFSKALTDSIAEMSLPKQN